MDIKATYRHPRALVTSVMSDVRKAGALDVILATVNY